jgi:hypothetical protein
VTNVLALNPQRRRLAVTYNGATMRRELNAERHE